MSTDFRERLKLVEAKIADAAFRAERSPSDIRLVAVTKTHPVETVRKATEAGLVDVGENKVQEAVQKITALGAESAMLRWHLIGHLQSNKAKLAVQHFDMIHSVDSIRLAQELNRHAGQLGITGRKILLQVNVSGEVSKSGFDPEAVSEALESVIGDCPNLRVSGLMTMAPFASAEDARPHFRHLKRMADELWAGLKNESQVSARPELSMGMTNDYEVAIEEGATIVRIGSALFGER